MKRILKLFVGKLKYITKFFIKNPIINLPVGLFNQNDNHKYINLPNIGKFSQFKRTTISADETKKMHTKYQLPKKEGVITTCLLAISEDRNKIIKIEIFNDPRKHNNLIRERAVIKQLNGHNCLSAPLLLGEGEIKVDDLLPLVEEFDAEQIIKSGLKLLPYLIQEFIPSAESLLLSDIIVSLLEQKKAGVYHGDIKPGNLRFDPNKNRAVFVDYDQAEILDDDIKNLDNSAFLNWCDIAEKRKYNYNTWLRHFAGLTLKRHIIPLLKDIN